MVQGIKVGNFIYPSGQVPAKPSDSWPVEDFRDQIRQAIENLIAVVEAGGGTKENIIKCAVFLKDMSRFDLFNEVYSEYFQKDNNPPARSCFGVTGLAGPYDIEIEGIAYVGDDVERIRTEKAPLFDMPFVKVLELKKWYLFLVKLDMILKQVMCQKHLKVKPDK